MPRRAKLKAAVSTIEPLISGGFHVLWPEPLSLPCSLSLISDTHIGAAQCDYDLLQSDLDQANGHNDRIVMDGDVFDMILPGDSKRFTPATLHPRLQGCTDIINKAVDWAVELFEPYSFQIDMIGSGNHDSACEKFHSVDPVLLLVDRLNNTLKQQGSRHRILYGGYAGFLCYKSFTMYYHHGWGHGSSLSASAGDLARALQSVEGVDFIWLGHRHSRLAAHVVRVAPPTKPGSFTPVLRDVRFLRTGSYLRSHWPSTPGTIASRGRQGSYAIDAGLVPTGLGGLRMCLLESDVPGQPFTVQVVQ